MLYFLVANNGASTVSAFNANITAANVNSAIISFVATGAGPGVDCGGRASVRGAGR